MHRLYTEPVSLCDALTQSYITSCQDPLSRVYEPRRMELTDVADVVPQLLLHLLRKKGKLVSLREVSMPYMHWGFHIFCDWNLWFMINHPELGA